MKNIKLFLTLLFIVTSYVSNASHLFGGEITWTCLGNGQYQFQVKVYRDCNGCAFTACLPPSSINVFGHPTICSIPIDDSLTVLNDISPPQCINNCTTGGPGTVEELILTSFPVTLAGVPLSTGWVFEINGCCRNLLTNLGAGGQSFSLRSIMYPYNGVNTDPCFDSSPHFAERPNVFTCDGYTFTYTPFAVDSERDSLIYEWSSPVEMPTASPCSIYNGGNILFTAPYTITSQLPGSPTLNPQTGEISFNPTGVTGNFATCIKVTAYKCGIKVAEIFRDCGFTITSGCIVQGVPPNNVNLPPVVTAPFNGLFTDTIVAGDTVNFSFMATDFQSNIGGTFQTVTIDALGDYFGAGYTNPSAGCPFPPCATLTPPPPITVPIGASTNFNWITDCSHTGFYLNCTNQYFTTYYFMLKATDDYCPAPAKNYKVISITITGPDIQQIVDSMFVNYPLATGYQWYVNGTIIPGATNSYYVTSVAGVYHCMLTTASGCQMPSQMRVIGTTQLQNISEASLSFDVSPNPAKNNLTVQIVSSISSNAEIIFTDIAGKIVLTKTLKLNSGKNKLIVSDLSLAKGFYNIQLSSLNKTITQKLIVE